MLFENTAQILKPDTFSGEISRVEMLGSDSRPSRDLEAVTAFMVRGESGKSEDGGGS